jgi:peptidyl-prolyl cis-trans isomerase SurA
MVHSNFTFSFLPGVYCRKMALTLVLMMMPLLWLASQTTQDPVLLTIGNENVTKSEFLSIYQKNNVNGEVMDKKSLEEYLELFINFKLKVKEAEDLGLDTVPSFITELKGYRDQLAKPYFVDEELNAKLLQQAYERKKQDIRVSHILIRVEKFTKPADTLEAYNKILAIRERIVKGEDFNAVAEEVSEDPSARDMPARGFQPARKGNRGDIGYFSVFDMVYPFEEAAYNLPVGQVSMPVRTDFGYHLVLVQAKYPALGKVQVAHLFLQIAAESKHADSVRIAAKADSLYKALQAGSDWDELVRNFSDDKSSSMTGGVLPWFGSNRMVPDFIDGIRHLSDSGQISKPVLTSYGWHIIKLVEKKPVGSFEDEKADLKQSLAKDVRSNKSKESIIIKVKKEANYVDYPKAINEFVAAMDSSIYKRKWEISKAANLNSTIFKLGDEKYSQQLFAEYIVNHQSISSKEAYDQFINDLFKRFVDEKVIEYEDARLESKYPEFKALVKEYRDGILLFELTDQKVWSKAIKDTTGLKEFHEIHKMDYVWGDRIDATIVTAANEEGAKEVMKMAKKGKTVDEMWEAFKNDTIFNVKVVDKKYPKGESNIIDNIEWKAGISKIVQDKDGRFGFAIVKGLVAPEPKSISEARGLITADYQNYLEKEWIQELKTKYTVNVNKEVLSTIK